MSKIEHLDSKLTSCAEQLVECAAELNDLGILKEEKAIYKIGKAIAEINEIRSGIYKLRPDLEPKLWSVPPTEKHYMEWFKEAKNVALEYIKEERPQNAIDTFESLIFIGPPGSIVKKARKEIERIKNEYNVK